MQNNDYIFKKKLKNLFMHQCLQINASHRTTNLKVTGIVFFFHIKNISISVLMFNVFIMMSDMAKLFSEDIHNS